MAENSSSHPNKDNELLPSNNDHSEWNQKKQDMILNLGLVNNFETDQTPTPTRFIRNCEEVGLFQDLQNVNPFDEVFKKAVENPASVNLQVPVTMSDDTLHTPQIYPQLEENSSNNNNGPTPNNQPLNKGIPSIDQRDDIDNPLIIVLDAEKDESEVNVSKANSSKMRAILKATLNQKSSITPVPIDKLIDPEKRHRVDILRQRHRSEILRQRHIAKVLRQRDVSEVLRQREANKAAQSRCRKRKRKEFEDMSMEIEQLKKNNVKLAAINVCLEQTIKRLQRELQEARSTNNMSSGPQNEPRVVEGITAVSPEQTSVNATSNIMHGSIQILKSSPKSVNPNGKSKEKEPKETSEPSKPKPVTLSLPSRTISNPIGMPLPNIHNNSNAVVIIYPQPPQTILLPLTGIPKTADTKNSKHSNFRKIMPK